MTQVVLSPVSLRLAMAWFDLGEAKMELDLIAFFIVILRSMVQNKRTWL